MTNVIAWPPVEISDWGMGTVQPISRSEGLIQGTARRSSRARARKYVRVDVWGHGTQGMGAGYMNMLIDQLDGGVNLIRLDAFTNLSPQTRTQFNGAVHPTGYQNDLIDWTSGGVDLNWTSGAADLLWSDNLALSGSPTMDGSWFALSVTGFPPNSLIARPGERITVKDGPSEESAHVLTAARSDGSGAATIRLDAEITLTGIVSLGEKESLVFETASIPRASQRSDFVFSWSLRQVFADEYASWTEIDPWR